MKLYFGKLRHGMTESDLGAFFNPTVWLWNSTSSAFIYRAIKLHIEVPCSCL